MTTTEPTDPTPAPTRSLAPDLSRGLMLALIAIANVSWYLWGTTESVGTSPHIPATTALDSVVQTVMTIAVDSRALPMFAFLFGYGMVQFYRSRIDRGIAPRIVRVMLRRRHWAMFLLGFLHAALLFHGDILGAYAVGGLLLVWIFFGRSTRTLVVWASVIAGLMVVGALFAILGAVMMVAFAPPEAFAQMEAGMAAGGLGMSREWAYGQPYLVGMLARIGTWLVGAVPMSLLTTPVPILLGWIAARHRLLDEPWRHVKTLRRIALGGIAIGWVGGLPAALMYLGALPLPSSVSWAFSGLTPVTGIACGVGYAAAFALLALRLERRTTPPESAPPGPADTTPAAEAPRPPDDPSYGVPADPAPPVAAARPGPVARALSAVGERSLTFYLFQSVLLAPLMAAWGFGLGGTLSTAPAVGIAFLVWLVSLPIAAWLGSTGRRGPAEALLRRMTYGKNDTLTH
ncbi:DUF418 domain-containing protein [Brevibacterium litoralis]|uniref:DUF418 domain-containing protein n=1 Tax=Brevibacterium litoralis TaxID=3138935 RepID=UPI0032EE2C9A